MGKFRRTVVESAILVAGGIYIYRNVLTPETKAAFKHEGCGVGSSQ